MVRGSNSHSGYYLDAGEALTADRLAVYAIGLRDRPAPSFAPAVFKGLAHLPPPAHFLHLKNERFSRDPRIVAKMNEDPDRVDGACLYGATR